MEACCYSTPWQNQTHQRSAKKTTAPFRRKRALVRGSEAVKPGENTKNFYDKNETLFSKRRRRNHNFISTDDGNIVVSMQQDDLHNKSCLTPNNGFATPTRPTNLKKTIKDCVPSPESVSPLPRNITPYLNSTSHEENNLHKYLAISDKNTVKSRQKSDSLPHTQSFFKDETDSRYYEQFSSSYGSKSGVSATPTNHNNKISPKFKESFEPQENRKKQVLDSFSNYSSFQLPFDFEVSNKQQKHITNVNTFPRDEEINDRVDEIETPKLYLRLVQRRISNAEINQTFDCEDDKKNDSTFTHLLTTSLSPQFSFDCSSISNSSQPETPPGSPHTPVNINLGVVKDVFENTLQTPQAPLRPNRTRKSLLHGIMLSDSCVVQNALQANEDPNLELNFPSQFSIAVSLDQKINRCLPLLAAASQAQFSIVKLLLEYGAVANSINQFGQTAAHLACRFPNSSNEKKITNNNSFYHSSNDRVDSTSQEVPEIWKDFKSFMDTKFPFSAKKKELVEDENSNDCEKAESNNLFYDDNLMIVVPKPVPRQRRESLNNMSIASQESEVLNILKLLIKHNIDLSLKDTFGNLAIDYARSSKLTAVESFLSGNWEEETPVSLTSSSNKLCHVNSSSVMPFTTQLSPFPTNEISNSVNCGDDTYKSILKKKFGELEESLTPSVKQCKQRFSHKNLNEEQQEVKVLKPTDVDTVSTAQYNYDC